MVWFIRNYGCVMDKTTKRLLLLLIEECAEISQAASKSIRFGFDSTNPYIENAKTKEQELIQELGDLALIIDLLNISEAKIARAKFNKLQEVLANNDTDLAQIIKDVDKYNNRV